MKIISTFVVLFHAMGSYAFPHPQLQTLQSSGGSSGGNLGVECKTEKTGKGRYKVNCAGVNQDAIALRSEHILWLQGPSGEQSVVDIEIPNYKIAELIKAGFKQSKGEGPKINVLLKKPEQTYDAQVDVPKADSGVPTVNLQYEAVDKTVVHFPNDKAYSPLTGPILPPPNGGSGGGSASGNPTATSGNPPPPAAARTSRQTAYSGKPKRPQYPRYPDPATLINHRLSDEEQHELV